MSFFEELKRRNVVRVGVAYAAIGWVLAQVAEFAFDTFGAPEWALRTFVMALVLGLPLALFFAWAFELTPEGLKREKDVDRSRSITKQTGRKLDRLITGVLVLAVGFLLADKFLLRGAPGDDREIVATEGRQSIAVLPFVNMSDDNDHFSDGLTEELMNVLAKSPDLKVAGRTSSFAFKGQTPNFRQIGDALGVEHVLEGSVRRSGDSIRVTAQLIKVEDGFHVWSETYDRQMAEIFEIQDDVAGAISRELNLRLAPVVDRPTANLDAYALYLQVRAEVNAELFLDRAIIDRIDRILGLDPGFAAAAELKAIAYWYMSGITLDTPTGRGLIHESALAALRLDPDLVVARALADTSLPDEKSWVPEFDAVERAVAQLPDDYLVLGMHRYELSAAGYFAEALPVARRMLEIEPLASNSHHQLAVALMSLGNDAEAYAAWQRAADLGDDYYLINIARGLVVSGNHDAAVEPLGKAWASAGLDPAAARPFIEGATDPVKGKAFLDAWIRQSVSEARDFESRLAPYMWYLAFGYLDDYFAVIDRYYAETDTTWTNADALEQLGVFYSRSGYLSHPKFIRHMQRISMTEIWDRRGPPDRCRKIDGDWVCE